MLEWFDSREDTVAVIVMDVHVIDSVLGFFPSDISQILQVDLHIVVLLSVYYGRPAQIK